MDVKWLCIEEHSVFHSRRAFRISLKKRMHTVTVFPREVSCAYDLRKNSVFGYDPLDFVAVVTESGCMASHASNPSAVSLTDSAVVVVVLEECIV